MLRAVVAGAINIPPTVNRGNHQMAEHQATIDWQRDGAMFVDSRYSRGHHWEFDCGVRISASSSPHVVPLPYSVSAAVDPEEAFVAALSSCAMSWCLLLASNLA